MKICIRHETPADYRNTEIVAREAFWNLYFPGAEEHYLIHQMRNHPDFIPQLSFVMEVDGKIQGGIFYTHSKIAAPNTDYPTITFGPVFVAPEYQRQGLGRKMIGHSIQQATAMRFRAILTLGYPYHYKPYGFCGGKKYGISMPDGKFYTGLLVLPLRSNSLSDCTGHVVFSDVFEIDRQKADTFDSQFPPKEKCVLPCQHEYEIACAMLDE